MNIDSDSGGGNRGHGGFRPDAGRKRKEEKTSTEIVANERRQQAEDRQSISRQKRKLAGWIDKVKWSHKGVPATYRDNATALLVIFNLMLENASLTQRQAIKKAGLYLGRGHSSLDLIVSHWNKYEEVYVESGTRGGSSGQQSSVLFLSLPVFIINTIMDRFAEGKTTNISDIQQAIIVSYGEYIGYWPLYYLLHDKMKLSYGVLKDSPSLTQDANRLRRIAQFLIKHAFALQLEEKSKAIICYMDESYVTTGHHSHYGWYVVRKHGNIRTGIGNGKRLILVHAITRDGLLHTTDTTTGEITSAEWIYEANNPTDDYHCNMDDHNFRLWINQFLFPAFEAKYGRNKRMILLLDNAPYHKKHGEDYVNLKSMSKTEMIDLLRSKDVRNIPVVRNGHVENFSSNLWKFNGPAGPYKRELQMYMESWIRQYPQLQRTLLEKLFEEKSLDTRPNMPDYHYLIFTPPYCPQVQPMELVWAYVKAYVAKQFKPSRTLQQLIEQTKVAFTGDGIRHEGVSKKMVRDMISHTHKYCNILIDDDPLLKGSIDNLKNPNKYEEDAEDDDDEDINIDTSDDDE